MQHLRELHEQNERFTPSEEIIDQILKLEKPEEQMDWVTVQLRAALIRCYLCLRLVRTADLCAPINCRHGNNPIWLENWNEMLALLQDGQQLLMRAEDLEAVISALRMESATQEDYALGFSGVRFVKGKTCTVSSLESVGFSIRWSQISTRLRLFKS